MRVSYDDGRERLREQIAAPSSGEAVAYAVVATVLGFIGGFALWAHTGEVALLPGAAAAAGGFTLLLKGISHHRIVASTYRYDVAPLVAPQPSATPVKVEYWERTETGHRKRVKESSVAREQWLKVANAIARDGAGALSRRRAGVPGPVWAMMADELRALGMIAADEHLRHVGEDGARYIRGCAGLRDIPPTSERSPMVNPAQSGLNPTQPIPNPVNPAPGGRVVAMEPIAADDGILWAAAYMGAAIIGFFGTWRLCEAVATAAGLLG